MWRSPSQTFRSITSRTRDIIWGIWLVTKDLEVYYPSWNPKVSQSRPDRWLFHFLSHLRGVQVMGQRPGPVMLVRPSLTVCVFWRLGEHTCWRAKGRSPGVHVLHHQCGPDWGGSLWVTQTCRHVFPSEETWVFAFIRASFLPAVHVEDIVFHMFQYIQKLRTEGPQEWVFQECKVINLFSRRLQRPRAATVWYEEPNTATVTCAGNESPVNVITPLKYVSLSVGFKQSGLQV